METKQVFDSWDTHFYNNEWVLVRAELTWGINIDYTTNPKRVTIKR